MRTGVNNHESPSCTATATDGIRAVPSCDIFRLIRSVHAIASKSSSLGRSSNSYHSSLGGRAGVLELTMPSVNEIAVRTWTLGPEPCPLIKVP
jgi:hypothetical protein